MKYASSGKKAWLQLDAEFQRDKQEKKKNKWKSQGGMSSNMSKFYDISRDQAGAADGSKNGGFKDRIVMTQRAGNFFLKKKMGHNGQGLGLTKNLSLNVGQLGGNVFSQGASGDFRAKLDHSVSMPKALRAIKPGYKSFDSKHSSTFRDPRQNVKKSALDI
jgi:hypothetical protein